MDDKRLAVVGGGPAGLMAAEVAAAAGVAVDLFDAMPSVGRKFLLAGKGGLNLTHSEPAEAFVGRYGNAAGRVAGWLDALSADDVRAWAQGLGIDTFVGSSGRVFPREMKAAPLLRAWLRRLRDAGVRFHVRHRWLGWTQGEDGSLRLAFATPDGQREVAADALVLALGGGSWPQLGSDGAWTRTLAESGVAVAELQPANCGFDVAGAPGDGWSGHFRERHAGQPLKSVELSGIDAQGRPFRRCGELMLSATGIEGSLVYAVSATLRELIAVRGEALVHLDLAPDRDAARVIADVTHPRGSRSWSGHLQSRMNLRGARFGLLRELVPEAFADPAALAQAIKALPLRLLRPRPLAEAISTAGGIGLDEVDASLMLRHHPGVFCAGEMLDWEAPTGGYLLTACLAGGRVAGTGAVAYLKPSIESSADSPCCA